MSLLVLIYRMLRYRTYRIARYVYFTSSVVKKGILLSIISFFIRRRLLLKYNIFTLSNINVGIGLKLPHPHSILFGRYAKIGDNCTIYHDVTIGQNNGKTPVVGNNVIIYPGARIIGNIKIGDNVVIGANAVVVKDIPNNVVVAGNPAVIIKERDLTDGKY